MPLLQELQPVCCRGFQVIQINHVAEVPMTAIELFSGRQFYVQKLLQNDISAANQLKELGPFPQRFRPWAILQNPD